MQTEIPTRGLELKTSPLYPKQDTLSLYLSFAPQKNLFKASFQARLPVNYFIIIFFKFTVKTAVPNVATPNVLLSLTD